MSVDYGLTIDNHKLILAKAKTKNDGVFSFRGVAYRVRDNAVTHFAVDGKVLEFCYGFNCVVGTYKYGLGNSSGKKALLAIS